MSGKPYTMREMKTIVEYLTEQKAFSEIKGRKMWMDFANSSVTTRTWQSLKETFLKRILPDIHNPYYKLSREEILSFRQGCDIEAKDKMNKLEIHTISDDSDKNSDTNNKKEKDSADKNISKDGVKTNPSSNIGNVEDTAKNSEENKEASQKPNSNDKVLENSHKMVEDEENKVELPDRDDIPESISKSPNDFLRDKTYTQPIAPLLQDVINDFDTESEDSDKEPKMEIVEDSNKSVDDGNESKSPQGDDSPVNMAVTDVAKNAKGLSAEVVEEVLLSEIQDSGIQAIKSKSMNLKKSQKNTNDDKGKTQEVVIILSEKDNSAENEISLDEINTVEDVDKEKKQNKDSQNSSGDTLIPNNQECFGKTSLSNENEKSQGPTEEHFTSASRKRASSEETLVLEYKKRKNDRFDELLKDTTTQNRSEQNGVEKDKEKSNVPTTKNRNATTKNSKEKSSYENPCFKSVNLFTDQFTNSKLDDSETSDAINSTTNKVGSKDKIYNIKTSIMNKDVLVLQSHSETESHTDVSPKKDPKLSRIQRKKALANVFGFSSGTVTSSRKTKLSLKKASPHHKYNETGSRTSEWTSESESEEFVSPPRARRNRPTKKYLKPKSARILSLEEEGGLFVMYGKRIYPLVKDGKMIKNYLTYKPNSESDLEEDKYWKQKYAEEKKKTDELKKLLEESKKLDSDTMPSPILPPPRNITRQTNINNRSHKEVQVQETTANEDIDKTMKIKLTRNNEEVYLEGRWPQIETVLKHVVNIIDTKAQEDNTKKTNLNVPELKQAMVLSSGESTPVTFDPVTHEKVNKLESEIFKEIEKRDKLELPKEDALTKSPETNVTKRGRGRPRNSSTTPVPSPAKKSRLSEERTPTRRSVSDSKKSLEESKTKNNTDESKTKNNTDESKAKKNAEESKSKKNMDESKSAKEKVTPKKNKASKKSVSSSDEDVATVRKTRSSIGKLRRRSRNVSYDESNARYMLANRLRSARTANKNTRNSNRSFAKPSIYSSLDNSRMSESTQGYQDSDFSPFAITRKRKFSLPAVLSNNRIKHRSNPTRKLLVLNQDNSSDSNHSLSTITVRNQTVKSSSDIYKSDSYLHLFANNDKNKKLEKIDENLPLQKYTITELQQLDPSCADPIETSRIDYFHSPLNMDVGSSSNVSLPQSPELSLVETISVCKDLISSSEDHINVDELQKHNANTITNRSTYLMSEVDVTIPLMEQLSEVKVSNGCTQNISKRATVSESLLNQIGTVGIRDSSSVSDGLDKRLSELLLESAKKMSVNNNGNMEIDDDEKVSVQVKKLKGKKRCSTPRKKKENKLTTAPNIQAIDEHMEYSRNGAKSCPPLIHIMDENAMDCDENNYFNKRDKTRKKKDVIKVKILRPRQKSCCEEKNVLLNEIADMSVCSDSGINATEMDCLFPFDRSVDLIHNHSETCLRANECVADSVEFVDISNTIISLNTDSNPSQDWGETGYENAESIFTDLVNDIQNMYAKSKTTEEDSGKGSGNNFDVPEIDDGIIDASLMTEDLSDENPTQSHPKTGFSKWYLFSDDETTNTNQYGINTGGSGSNLNQIFPITCAIPDLSTITEMSKENDNSRKTNFNIDYAAGDAQNINII